ncbi:MAG: hypothetical protein FJY88_03035 [Candidatus Eisenbacteria bacterium]|nr:hypothetical protein [Candidatus Eisenbacteria bacterium]
MNITPEVIWIWIGAFMTLSIFSFLYRDNPFYRFAEHLFVGASNGWTVGFYWHLVLKPILFRPLGEAFRTAFTNGLSWSHFNPAAPANFMLIVPFAIGMLYFMRFVPRASWLVRFPIGIFMGYYTGLAIPVAFTGALFPQLKGTIVTRGSFADPIAGLWAVLVLIGVLGTLIYFFFSKEQKGIFKIGAKTGIVYIMLGFGASFGFTVMARVSLALGRFVFLLRDWLGVIS